jgi:hypothetical protein
MEQNIFEIAQGIQADLGITEYDQLSIWRLKYYENNLVTPISRNNPLPHAQFVFNQINSANAISLSPYDFTLSPPSDYSNAQYPTLNTQITITPAELTGYTGSMTVYYNRINISQVLGTQSTSIVPAINATLLSDIIPQINTAYGLDLQTGDYTDAPLPVIPVTQTTPEPISVTIAIDPACLKYTGTYNYILNYQNNSTTLQVSPNNPNARALIVFNTPSATLINQQVMLFNLYGQQDTSFSLAINASNITTFTIASSFYEKTTNTLYLNGVFDLTYTIGVTQTTGNYTTLILNSQGFITQGLVTPLFNLETGFNWAVNRYLGLYYAFNSTASPSLSLVRYLPTGLVDTTFVPNIPYAPVSVFPQAGGNIYIVSTAFIAVNPYNTAQIAQPLVRIDRLLSTGQLDSTFNTVYLSASIIGNNICTVTDILETSVGTVELLVNELSGYGVNSNVPVINNTPIVPTNSTSGSTVTWTPLISLLMNGSINVSFNNVLNSYTSSVISIDPTKTNTPSLNLNFYNGRTSFWAYVKNPINAQSCFVPLSFDIFGNPYYYSLQSYQNLPIYQSMSVINTYSDGTYVIKGTLASINMNGVLSAQKDLAAIINPDGTTVPLAPMQTGVFPSGTVSIESVYSF